MPVTRGSYIAAGYTVRIILMHFHTLFLRVLNVFILDDEGRIRRRNRHGTGRQVLYNGFHT